MEKFLFTKEWTFWKEEDSPKKQAVTLPHDAMIHEQRSDAFSNAGHAYFPGGIYHYEKKFSIRPEWVKKQLILEFEGIYKNATVLVNGKKLAFQAYGYTGFFVELPGLEPGEEVCIHVIADNSKLPNSRWYSGSGIYRPVWLYVCELEGFRPECVKITTLSAIPPRIRVESPIDAEIEVFDGEQCLAKAHGTSAELEIPGAKLWSAETPHLYSCRLSAGKTPKDQKDPKDHKDPKDKMDHESQMDPKDQMVETFGICKIEWSKEGLLINGARTQLRGGCIHHDNGILGAAEYEERELRRIRIMKENGFNAVRSAHNPASKALLDACDRLGMYVMDESFDMWFSRKTAFDYGCDFRKNWKQDTQAMVRKDRNHPSVILYSIGNEVAEPASEEGLKAGKGMIDLIHQLDPSRPVTCGTNLMILSRAAKGKGIYQDGGQEKQTGVEAGGKVQNSSLFFNMIASIIGTAMNKAGNSRAVDRLSSPFLDMLDIAGYNYASGRYPLEGKVHPDCVIFGSETFAQDIFKNWKMVETYPYLIGDFLWAGWDYLGEAGIGAWSCDGSVPFNRPYPWLLSGAGVIDINGIPDGSCKYAGVVWGKEKKPVIAVRPANLPQKRVSKSVWRASNAILSWSWRGCEGKKTLVEVYAQASEAELLLNGRSLGRKKMKEYKAIFPVRYASGTLCAAVYNKQGQELGRTELHSAEGELSIRIQPEKLCARPGEIVYVPVSIRGKNDVIESNADTKINVSVEGGELLAFGSAIPCTEERYDEGSFTTYHGQALAVVRAGEPGKITICVEGGGMHADTSIKII